ncbi:amylo-alpha-1,6-glucosidase [uncultured Ferrovibrio sp.]|jgi:glycogen debranching enzyme|uniref:amylo-alpha-1,6-glucosidase n=1 Tax=uncultured Ferrovibrio sp. TaxID=1576913 RepID=UPI0026042E33|nr:amylo-alpha-1,6-glucosidase [uncultured Ferrovibrio sp.]
MSQGLSPAAAVPQSQEKTVAEPRVPNRLYALKEGDTFIIADAYGNILGEGDGLFHNDTRILSDFRLTLAGERPSLLSAAISRDNIFFTAHVTNRPLPPLGGRSLPEGVIHIERSRFLWDARLYERICCVNYSDREAALPLGFRFGADFFDMFEVRGQMRQRRGRMLPVQVENAGVTFRYEGLDGLERATCIAFSHPPSRLTADRADFLILLPPNGCIDFYLEIGSMPGTASPSRVRYRAAAAKARRAMRLRLRRGGRLRSNSRLFNAWLDKSRADLALLTSELPTGPYPYAGIPWFSTPFGRDAIITALQTLWFDPALARGVLKFLAQHQAQETSSFRDSAPGKIMHETRKGEMPRLQEVPFERYYGGVDTTPLFIMLAGAYAERTNDLAFIEDLWPALVAALSWIESVMQSTPTGFLVYARGETSGLANQGWKDSEDSIFHADGSNPKGPIALVEVQGYVFAALTAMAKLAERRGDAVAAGRWQMRSEMLRRAVEDHFWMPEAGFYGIALDGDGSLCRVRASNAGHLLYVGLPVPDRAAKVTAQILSGAFDSGWGVRTLAPGQARYNPMSYHNGSVWPHDTALCAAGLARYGERDGVIRLLDELFEAAVHYDMRLPELFCGFPRAKGEPPIDYPVACLPQAWAAGAIFMLLQAGLGLRIDGERGEIHIHRPALPSAIDRLVLSDIGVGDAKVNLVFQRVGSRVVAFSDDRISVPIIVHS